MTQCTLGNLSSGEPIEAYTLKNSSGASAQILTYGGILMSLQIPDRNGHLEDIVLGYKDLAPYLAGHPFFGAVTGRIAGRVTDGIITVEGKEDALACNDGRNHLHGGVSGLDKRLWTAEPSVSSDGGESLRLTYRSPDGEEGYPGTIELAITYTLTDTNALVIDSEASADRVTPLCLTNHSYFNLAGEGSGSVADHKVQILADAFIPTDDEMTLLGTSQTVTEGGNDFRTPRRLGDALPRLFKSHGDVYLLRSPHDLRPTEPTLVARITEPRFGRVLEVFTDESCLQFYTAVSLDGTDIGKSGRPYEPHAGLCLECQGYANGSSTSVFGDILIRPGQPQRHRTIYGFSTT